MLVGDFSAVLFAGLLFGGAFGVVPLIESSFWTIGRIGFGGFAGIVGAKTFLGLAPESTPGLPPPRDKSRTPWKEGSLPGLLEFIGDIAVVKDSLRTISPVIETAEELPDPFWLPLPEAFELPGLGVFAVVGLTSFLEAELLLSMVKVFQSSQFNQSNFILRIQWKLLSTIHVQYNTK